MPKSILIQSAKSHTEKAGRAIALFESVAARGNEGHKVAFDVRAQTEELRFAVRELQQAMCDLIEEMDRKVG